MTALLFSGVTEIREIPERFSEQRDHCLQLTRLMAETESQIDKLIMLRDQLLCERDSLKFIQDSEDE